MGAADVEETDKSCSSLCYECSRERPDDFDPLRFEREFNCKSDSGDSLEWLGFDPLRGGSNRQLYPNEIQSDFAFLPFGGGPRKCVGDQVLCAFVCCLLVLLFKEKKTPMSELVP